VASDENKPFPLVDELVALLSPDDTDDTDDTNDKDDNDDNDDKDDKDDTDSKEKDDNDDKDDTDDIGKLLIVTSKKVKYFVYEKEVPQKLYEFNDEKIPGVVVGRRTRNASGKFKVTLN